MKKIIDRFSAIKADNKELVSGMIQKAVKNGDTVYGELSDWIRDYHNDLSLLEREVLCKMLLGDMVIHHPDWINRIKPNKLMILCSYDEEEREFNEHLVVSKQVFENEKERIREYLDDVFELENMDEEDEEEYRECVADLLKGKNGYFGIEYYWEEKEAIL